MPAKSSTTIDIVNHVPPPHPLRSNNRPSSDASPSRTGGLAEQNNAASATTRGHATGFARAFSIATSRGVSPLGSDAPRRVYQARPPVNAAPTSYAEWSALLDRCPGAPAESDAEILALARTGTIVHGDGVTNRLVERIVELINRRLRTCNELLQAELKRGHGEMEFVQAILVFRKRMEFPKALAAVPVLPDNIRTQLGQGVVTAALKAQESLLESAKADGTGRLALWIRQNPLVPPNQPPPIPTAASHAEASSISPRKGRQIIV